MKRKKTFFLIALAAGCIGMTGCAGNDTEQAASADVINIQIAYENNPGEPIDLACQKWKELLEEESDGQFHVELYPSSQLGTKGDIIN